MLSPIPQYSSSSVAQARSSIREDRVQGLTLRYIPYYELLRTSAYY